MHICTIQIHRSRSVDVCFYRRYRRCCRYFLCLSFCQSLLSCAVIAYNNWGASLRSSGRRQDMEWCIEGWGVPSRVLDSDTARKICKITNEQTQLVGSQPDDKPFCRLAHPYVCAAIWFCGREKEKWKRKVKGITLPTP